MATTECAETVMTAASAALDVSPEKDGGPGVAPASAAKRKAPASTAAKAGAKKRGRRPAGPKLQDSLGLVSKQQLVALLVELTEKTPEVDLGKRVEALLPPPDLESIQKSLHKTCAKVRSSLPNVRFGSNRDNYSYKRISGVLQQAKKELLEHANDFASAKGWGTLLSYLDFAVDECVGLPHGWESDSMERPRQMVAEHFSKHMEKALKQQPLSTEELQRWKAKLTQYGAGDIFKRALAAVNSALGDQP